MLFLFAFVIRHTLCHQKLVCKSVGQSIRGMGGGGARRLMRRPAPTMLFLFAFVIRHALCHHQKLVCKSVGQSTWSINMPMLYQRFNPGNHHWRISVALHVPLLHHQSVIQIKASPLPLLQKICISCTNRKAKLPSAQASN